MYSYLEITNEKKYNTLSHNSEPNFHELISFCFFFIRFLIKLGNAWSKQTKLIKGVKYSLIGIYLIKSLCCFSVLYFKFYSVSEINLNSWSNIDVWYHLNYVFPFCTYLKIWHWTTGENCVLITIIACFLPEIYLGFFSNAFQRRVWYIVYMYPGGALNSLKCLS